MKVKLNRQRGIIIIFASQKKIEILESCKSTKGNPIPEEEASKNKNNSGFAH